MIRCCVLVIGLMALPAIASAEAPVATHLDYVTFAAGLRVAEVEAGFGLGPDSYQLNLAYHTTGMVGFFFSGHQSDIVGGRWQGLRPLPTHFLGHGVWRGQDRVIDIDYANGQPTVRRLVPPNDEEREVVPEALRAGTIDPATALAQLVHVVQATGRCETDVRTYDGRRLVEIKAVTRQEDILPPTSRSVFSGRALRCDFDGRLVAGFQLGEDPSKAGRPMHGSAWLAAVAPNGPLVPVRMVFETRWFGEATMYLTAVGDGVDLGLPPDMR